MVLTALQILKVIHSDHININHSQQQVINTTLLILKKTFSNLLYAAIKTTDNGSELWLFLYMDKTKPSQLN